MSVDSRTAGWHNAARLKINGFLSPWRFLVMKRICVAGLLGIMAVGLTLTRSAAAGPVDPFLGPQTDAVIYIDLSAVDMDAIAALQQKVMAQLPPDQAARAQQQKARTDEQMAKARQWIDGFKKAGGKDMYIVVQLSGLFQGKPGAMLIPIPPGTDSTALANYLSPAGAAAQQPGMPPNPMQPQTAMIGQMLVFAPGAMIQDFKTATPQPRPDLDEGLALQEDKALRIVAVPSSLKRSPMLGMFTAGMGGGPPGGAPGGPPAGPFSDPAWNNVTWVSISGSLPPKESGNFTCQCKDADSANALADVINKKIQERKNDPKAQQMGADADKLAAALTPKVDGSKVVINLDQDTMDNVIIPIMSKAGAMQGGPPGGPGPGGPPPGTTPPPEGGGM